jgi:hypothetical protein
LREENLKLASGKFERYEAKSVLGWILRCGASEKFEQF